MGDKATKPIIFNARKYSLDFLKKRLKVTKVIDTYRLQLEDLFLIRNPRFRFNKNYQKDLTKFVKEHTKGLPLEKCGNWVYFPWNGLLVHYLEDSLHQELRTARNKNFITSEEQEKLYNTTIGIAGLSVGSNIAIALSLMGACRKIKIADPDVIAPSNLNRIITDFTNVGINKAVVIARYIYQVNPYAEIEIFEEGINKKNIKEFLKGLDILIEELDDIKIKIEIRKLARRKKIPVIMATDNGDNVIIDIERFDIKPNLPLFHGNIKNLDYKNINKTLPKLYKAMSKIIGLQFVPSRIIQSIFEVGKTIYSWPQLITAAMLSGAVVAYVVKKIILNEEIKSGKLEVNLNKIFDRDYNKELRNRRILIKQFNQWLKSLKRS
jgi:molybdopterin/thiamine biosynthesis adenylyltransferase